MVITSRTLIACLGLLALPVSGQTPSVGSAPEVVPQIDACNVVWDVPGPTSWQSMPLGNGDIGLNVWVEPTGDVDFYIGKTDSFDRNPGFDSTGLMKVGGVRLSMNPSPLGAGAPFRQTLKLHDGAIEIQEGPEASGVLIRLWVDANNPVIRVEARSVQPISYQVSLNDWRLNKEDALLPDQTNQLTWYHRNGPKADPHVVNLTFGAMIKGDGLVTERRDVLEIKPAHDVAAYLDFAADRDDRHARRVPLAARHHVKQIDALDLDTTRAEAPKVVGRILASQLDFCQRYQEEATDCTEGYVLQRLCHRLRRTRRLPDQVQWLDLRGG